MLTDLYSRPHLVVQHLVFVEHRLFNEFMKFAWTMMLHLPMEMNITALLPYKDMLLNSPFLIRVVSLIQVVS